MRKILFMLAALSLAACTVVAPPGTTPPIVTPPVVTPPVVVLPVVDTNAYPLAVSSAAPFTVGTGKHAWHITASNWGDSHLTYVVRIDGTVITQPFSPPSHTGPTAGDVLTINTDYPCTAKAEVIGVPPYGLHGSFFNEADCDYNPLWFAGDWDSRGGGQVQQGTDAFISRDGFNLLTIGLPGSPNLPAPPTPPTPPANITGAMINNSAVADNTLDKLLASVPAGGTLTLPAGTFAGSGLVPNANVTIIGAGVGKTIIDGKGIRPAQDKALILAGAPGLTIQNLSIGNSSVSAGLGGNAAGVRDNDNGIGFNLSNVELFGNQNGVLTFASNFNLDGVSTHNNGTGTGYTHNLYFGGNPTSVVNFANGKSFAPNGGHAFKSRAGTTNIANSVLTAGGDGAALDISDGGAVSLNNVTLAQPGTGPTHNVFTYALESGSNAPTGMTAAWTGVHIVDPMGVALVVCANGAGINLVGNDNTYQGPLAGPEIRGCAMTGGAIRKVN